MEMKRLHSVNETKSLVAGYVDALEVPRYNAAAVQSRRASARPEERRRPRMWVAIPAAVAAAIAIVAFAPAVVAQVQHVIQAFTTVNGRQAPLAVQEVTLEQLRADMPFRVVAPRNVPANLHEEISEIGTGSNAHAMFRFFAAGGPPVLTILEGNAADRSPSNVTVRYSTNGNMPALPPPARLSGSDNRTAIAVMRNGAKFRINIKPIEWEAHGTFVSVIAMPGALSRMQLDAIVRAMR